MLPTRAVAPLIAAAAALTLGVTQLAAGHQNIPFVTFADYLIEGSYALYLVAAVFAVLDLRAAHTGTGGWGRLGDIGAGLYALGHALLAVPVVVTFVRGDNPPEALFTLFTPGLVAWLLGLVLMAVGAFKARRIPRAVAVALPATLPLTLALGDPGVLVEVVTWAVLAAFLLRQMRAAERADPRATDRQPRTTTPGVR
jgi:hypothetical protein